MHALPLRRGATRPAPSSLFRPLLAALLPTLLIAALFAPASARADDGPDAWLDRMERAYADPELHRSGTGWKPYHRLRWFHDQRMVDGEPVPVGARWIAWERMRQRELTASEPPRAAWFNLGPANVAGRMLALEFDPSDPDILYAGSASGGLWKSTDGGASWSALTDDLPTLAVGGVCVWPADPNVVVIGTGEGTINIDRVGGVGILRSTDGGTTWSTTSVSYAVSSGHGFHFLEANPITGTMLAGATNGLWRSTDGGQNWTQVKVGDDYYDGVWKPGDANVCYVAKGDGSSANNVKVSTDDGATWAVAGTGQPNALLVGKTKIGVTAADPAMIYAIYAEKTIPSDLLGVYRSTDGGATWSVRATSPNMPNGQGWYNLSLAVDPDDADRVIAGGVSLYRSTDGGATFSVIGSSSVHVDHHAIAYRPGTTSNVFVGSDGGVWESTNDGTTWIDRNAGLVTYQFYDICVNNHSADPDFVMGGTQDQGTDRWSGTTTWSQGLGGDGMVCNINPLNGNAVYAEMQFGSHWKSTTAGLGSWTPINSGLTGSGDWVAPVDEDQNLGNHLYTATSDGIFRTTDGGIGWTNVAAHGARWISISPVDGNVVWTVQSTVKRTTDDGTTWTSAASFPFPTGTATKILAHPGDADAAFVTFSGYSPGLAHVALTTDGGASWQDVTGDLPDAPVNAIAVDPLNPFLWFVGTDVGVWTSGDGGTTWTPYRTGLPSSVVADLEIQIATRKLFCGTHGRGAWEVDFSDLLSLESDEERVGPSPPPPVDLKLDRPWPNPVSDGTTFRFAAREEGEVVLEIYDVAGRYVAGLARLPRGDGIIRNARWVPDDGANGVYFAVLRAGEARLTRKVIVAR